MTDPPPTPGPVPRAFRVHPPGGLLVQDCTLHPDGTITMLAAGQLWRCAFSLEEMLAGDWENSRIEWDPAPAAPAAAPDPAPASAAQAVPMF